MFVLDTKEKQQAFLQMFRAIVKDHTKEQLEEYARSEYGGGKNKDEYALIRKHLAQTLNRSEAEVDALVQVKQAQVESVRKQPDPGKELQGQPIICPEVEPWTEPVHGVDVFTGIRDVLSQYLAIPPMGAEIATLWIAHTHLYERFTHSPRLSIVSPTENCGKSTFLRALRLFVCRPMPSANLTVATGFRLVELYKPTILCDETNKWLATGSELVGILNSGYEAGSFIHRCIGDKHELRSFSCYSPVAMASIGQIRDSELRSRCLVIPMQRAKNGEVKKGWDSTNLEHETELARKLARWVKDNSEKVTPRPSSIPRDVYGRLADNWRPLFAIAEAVGGKWLKHCKDALGLARATEAKREEDNQKARLLADIREMFKERALTPGDYVLSADIVEHLNGLEDREWREVNRGKPINELWLSKRLGDFKLVPDRLPRAVDSDRRRGYPVAAFVELFDRYLSTSPASGNLLVPLSHNPVSPSKITGTSNGTGDFPYISPYPSQPFSEVKTPPGTMGQIEPFTPVARILEK